MWVLGQNLGSVQPDYPQRATDHFICFAASTGQPNRTADLRRITVPTLVIHGLDDPLVAPSGGLAVARAIPGSRFVGFSGMGHDLPRELWPEFVREIAALAALAALGEQRKA